MPLDVTHQVLVTKPRNKALRALATPVGTAVAQMTDFFERYDREKYGSEGAPLHDPCVIAYLIQPDLFSGPAYQRRDRDHIRADHGHDRG